MDDLDVLVKKVFGPGFVLPQVKSTRLRFQSLMRESVESVPLTLIVKDSCLALIDAQSAHELMQIWDLPLQRVYERRSLGYRALIGLVNHGVFLDAMELLEDAGVVLEIA